MQVLNGYYLHKEHDRLVKELVILAVELDQNAGFKFNTFDDAVEWFAVNT